MTTQPEFLSDTGQTSTESETCASAADTTLSQSMLSVEAFLVRIYPTPDEEQDLMEIEAGSSLKPLAWFANCDRERSCWRTWQRCLLEGWTEFSERWPRSGTMLNGIAYRLPPLVRRISGTGFLFSPTATANQLAPSMQKWPSCRATWATPTAAIATGGAPQDSKGKRDLRLDVKKAMWPTPNAQDHKAGMSLAPNRQQSSLPRSVASVEAVKQTECGGLNPTWVEWLMGFPLGWTDLNASETQ